MCEKLLVRAEPIIATSIPSHEGAGKKGEKVYENEIKLIVFRNAVTSGYFFSFFFGNQIYWVYAVMRHKTVPKFS